MDQRDYNEIASIIPTKPGIYKFLDRDHTILYVGKAKNLKSRLSSYFGDRKHMPYKARVMVKNAKSFEYTIVDTEQDALLLENTLIKKFQPRYNVMLKDGKSYSYLCIKNERFPRVFFTRRVYKDGSVYFGPYTSKYKAKVILDLIKKLFPLRTCTYNLSRENIQKGKFKVCLEYHIKNCLGPCEGLESEADYNQKINQVKNILRGHFKPVKQYIQYQMRAESEKLNFEKAQNLKEKLKYFEDYQSKSTVVSTQIRDLDVFTIISEIDYAYVSYLKIINGALINTDTVEMKKNLNENENDLLAFAIPSLRTKFNSIAPEVVVPLKLTLAENDVKVTVPQRGSKKKLLDLAHRNLKLFLLHKRKQEATKQKKQTSSERILKTLREDLHMDEIPYHIECFDNSNIQGANPASSCVVFRNTKPKNKEYRHFKIKSVKGPNDFASMGEVVYRRYKRLLEENKELPQLIIIDGGKGQLNAAMESLRKLGLEKKITMIGIAKRLEEIFFPGDPLPLYINKKSESLKLIQQARNEAHRFALKFHRNQRSKSLLKTELTEIPGVGEKTAKKLLKTVGSVEKIKLLKEEDLQAIVGPVLSKKIWTYFRSTNG